MRPDTYPFMDTDMDTVTGTKRMKTNDSPKNEGEVQSSERRKVVILK